MAAGEEILSFCSSCKLDLRHMIVAHRSGNTGAVAKVECKTCRKIHSYRAPKGAAGAISVKEQHKRPGKAKAEVIPISVEWNKQLNEHKGQSSKPYRIADIYTIGDVVEHTQFGLGIVQEIKDVSKVEVLFQNSLKVLVHNKKL